MNPRAESHRNRVRSRPRTALALVLSLLLAAGSFPTTALAAAGDAESSQQRFYRNGEQLFRLSVEGFGQSETDVLREGGELSIVLSRAIQPSLAAEREWETHGFRFDEQGRTIEDLGSDPTVALEEAGRQGSAAQWQEVLQWSVRSGAADATSTFRVGADWISVTLPREP